MSLGEEACKPPLAFRRSVPMSKCAKNDDHCGCDSSSDPVHSGRSIPSHSHCCFLRSLPMFTSKDGPTLENIVSSTYIAFAVIFTNTVVNFMMAIASLIYAAKQAVVQMDDGIPGTPRDWQEWVDGGRNGPMPYGPIGGCREVERKDERAKMKTVRARFLPGGGGYEEVRVACKLLDKLEEEGYGNNVDVVECQGEADAAQLVTGEKESWTRVLK